MLRVNETNVQGKVVLYDILVVDTQKQADNSKKHNIEHLICTINVATVLFSGN